LIARIGATNDFFGARTALQPKDTQPDAQTIDHWRCKFRHSLARLREAGIRVTPDARAGARRAN